MKYESIKPNLASATELQQLRDGGRARQQALAARSLQHSPPRPEMLAELTTHSNREEVQTTDLQELQRFLAVKIHGCGVLSHNTHPSPSRDTA